MQAGGRSNQGVLPDSPRDRLVRIRERLIRRPLRRLSDFLFGYDYFISYKQADGHGYPRMLVKRLSETGYSVFLDETVYAPGDDLRQSTRRRVRMSSVLVVLGRPGALIDSPWVETELREAIAAQRTLVLIDFASSLERLQHQTEEQLARLQSFRDVFQQRLRLAEEAGGRDGLKFDGDPSGAVVLGLQRSITGLRQDAKRARFFSVAALVFAIILVFALFQLWRAVVAEDSAAREARAARAGEKAALAELRRPSQPLAAAQLALEAVQITRAAGEATPSLAREAVLRSLIGIGGDRLGKGGPAEIVRSDVSESGRWLAAEGPDHVIYIWDLSSQGAEPIRFVTQTGLDKDHPAAKDPTLIGFSNETLVAYHNGSCPVPPRVPACAAVRTRNAFLDIDVYAATRRTVGVDANGQLRLWRETQPDVPLEPVDIENRVDNVLISASGNAALIRSRAERYLNTERYLKFFRLDGLEPGLVSKTEVGDTEIKEIAKAAAADVFASVDEKARLLIWRQIDEKWQSVQLRDHNSVDDDTAMAIALSKDGSLLALSFARRQRSGRLLFLVQIWMRTPDGNYRSIGEVATASPLQSMFFSENGTRLLARWRDHVVGIDIGSDRASMAFQEKFEAAFAFEVRVRIGGQPGGDCRGGRARKR